MTNPKIKPKRPAILVVLVARSKLIPDFAITLHAIHLVVSAVYSAAVPRHVLWWLTMLASCTSCVYLAAWGCRYRELQPIAFGGFARDLETGGEENVELERVGKN